ncbi:putative cation transporter [Elusimicrobium simillimum]|uniref:DUF1646 family protein n=1 Tax=Elusimicrobium simillimum TaxID=3143438 RepID=UPI003C6F8DBA
MLANILLGILVLIVLVLPLTIHKVEENLEIFLLGAGILAASISGVWNVQLVQHALTEPLHISIAVFIVGLLFKKFHTYTCDILNKAIHKLSLPVTLFLIVVGLGLASSIITAIVAALILSEIVTSLSLDRRDRLKLVVYTCFAISMGAVLTPIGEPLGTIVIGKLKGPPHYADSMFIFKLLWPYIVSGNIILGLMAASLARRSVHTQTCSTEAFQSFGDIVVRTLKVYIFVTALTLLGEGLKPLAYKTIFNLKAPVLYWVNLVSAALDNATLAAIEVVPEMSVVTLEYLLVSLIMCGGMLIPANIPNIISSSKLGFKSKEWAMIGIPVGMILMVVYFAALMIFVPAS